MTGEMSALSEREEIEMLLPWYVTGRLERADSARVEAYIARHPELRRQFDLVREEEAVTRAVNEAIAAPRSLTIEAQVARLTAGPAASPSALASNLVDLVRDFFAAPTARAVRYAAVAAVVVVLAQAAMVGALLSGRQQPAYLPASGSPGVAGEGTFALVRFNEAATLATLAGTLADLDIMIVDGPRPGGIFRVRLSAKALGEADRDQRLAQLRQRSDVVQLVIPSR